VLRSVFKMSRYRAVSVFAVAALLAYYFFAGPVFVNGVAGLAGLVPPQALVDASRALGVPIVWGVWRASLAGERAYEALSAGDGGVRIDEQRLARGAGGADARVQRIEIVERRSGKRFTAAPGKTLLESMEAAGVPIDYGCRSGLCGADAVCVVEGQEHLNEVGDDESATLARLGLTGRARLACCTRTKGPITVDCDLKNLPPAPKAEAREGAARKLGVIAGVERVVVVGNGAAGITVAEKLRERSDQLDITVLTDEPLHFYNRMALGRVVNGKSALEAMMLLPAAWYAERRIGVRLKAPVQGIDRQERTVVLAGERLPYDRLVLATGATAVLPGEDFAGRANAFVLRNAADAVSLRIAAERVAGARAVVLGGGVLGVEAAEALRACGLQVSLVHRAARLMERQLYAEGAQRLAGYLERRRIAVLTEAKVAGFEGRPLLKTLRLEDGRRIEAELFVACVGVAPNVRLAKEAGLGVRRGIVVDEAMRTSDPAILAVGDAAELVPKAGGAAGPGGLWTVAVQQGRCAAATILGVPAGDAVVAARIVLQLKSDGIDLRSFGDVAAAVPADAEVLSALVEDASNPAWWRLVVRGERIVSAVYVGPPGTSKALMQLLADDADISAHLGALREGQLGLEAAQPA
jgi:NADPH-dependent 2,4-dienoyl-CoA reductase/sulfur reductase-like enzyme/ferredoxin